MIIQNVIRIGCIRGSVSFNLVRLEAQKKKESIRLNISLGDFVPGPTFFLCACFLFSCWLRSSPEAQGISYGWNLRFGENKFNDADESYMCVAQSAIFCVTECDMPGRKINKYKKETVEAD